MLGKRSDQKGLWEADRLLELARQAWVELPEASAQRQSSQGNAPSFDIRTHLYRIVAWGGVAGTVAAPGRRAQERRWRC